MAPTQIKPTIRRSIDIATDLNAWLAWYTAMDERTAIGIVDEALRTWYEKHKNDFPNGPTVTSKPLEQVPKKPAKSRDV